MIFFTHEREALSEVDLIRVSLNHWPQDASKSCLRDGRYGRCQEVRAFSVFQKQA